jgi:EAL domain-containing protein (putative c-di-GMP-specific phosphodiesterase class I)
MPPTPAFSFAFQPIVDTDARRVFAYEALVRGLQNESAGSVFAAVLPDDLHGFDRDLRVRAIELAAQLGLQTMLSLNFLPRALDTTPDAVSSILHAAEAAGVPLRDLILEVTEGEVIHDSSVFAARMNDFRARGLRLAIDDFGAGYSGLNLLADFQPDLIKLDMKLVRGIDSSGPRQAIVRALVQACDDLGIEIIAEGVETLEEFLWFQRLGLRLFQGYLFGRPGFRCLPPVSMPSRPVALPRDGQASQR